MIKVEIELVGCDDTTYIKMELNKQELDFLDRLSKESHKMSSYSCMPVLDFKIEE